MGQTCKVCRAWEAYADVGQFPPIRLDSPEGKREALLVRDVHDRVAQREERGRLEVAIDGGEARRGAGEREARALGRRPETARARGRRPWSPLTEARSPLSEAKRGTEPKARTTLPHVCAGVALMELAAPCGAPLSRAAPSLYVSALPLS